MKAWRRLRRAPGRAPASPEKAAVGAVTAGAMARWSRWPHRGSPGAGGDTLDLHTVGVIRGR